MIIFKIYCDICTDMKYASLLFLLALCLGVTTSCKHPDPYISIDHSHVNCDYKGITDTVIVTSNYNWSAATTSPTITITPSSGSKDIPAIVVVDRNKDGVTKNMIVTFSSYNYSKVAQADYTITQTFDSPSISISPSSISAPHTVDTVSISLVSNFTWSAVDCGVIKVRPSAGTGADTARIITIAIPENTGIDDISHNVSFVCYNSEISDTVHLAIRQKGEPDPTISIEPDHATVAKEGGVVTVKVTSNYKWGSQVSDLISDISPSYAAAGTYSVNVNVPVNTTSSSYDHFVIFTSFSHHAEASDTLFIKQN